MLGFRRNLRPAAKTLQAIVRWRRLSFNDAPPIFGNGKPKSGSHLLLQVLAGLTRLIPYRYVMSQPVRTITKDGRRRAPNEIRRDLERIPHGVIGWGYLEHSAENVAVLCRPNRVNYFIYRDPRDLLVSHVFFATDMHEEHGMHAFYNSLPDVRTRLKVAITGIDQNGLRLVSVRQRYEAVLQWMQQEHVLCVRFEDLVDRREIALGRMLDEVEKTGYRIRVSRAEALRILSEAIQPARSKTFRLGKTGSWRDQFLPEHKRLFIDVAGDLLIQLGYERNNDW